MENQNSDFIHISKLIQEVTTEAMCVISPRQIIQFCNNAMVNTFGFTAVDEMLGLSSERLFSDAQQFLFLSNKINKEGLLNRERALFIRKDGSDFWGFINGRKWMHDGQYYYYFTLKDISERLKNEDFTRERTKALEKINAEFDRFIYSASHDLRAPISSIMGLIHLMKIDRDPANLDLMIALMEVSLSKIDKFIRNLSYFDRNKNKNTTTSRIDFKQILSRVTKRIASHTHFGSVDFQTHIQLPIPFYSNRFRIELVLEEVIRNAYDFHDMTKSRPYISVDIRGGREEVQITIEDNGSGIPRKYVNSVFNMFFRASAHSAGSGIGLFVTREAVNKLMGTITLDSSLGMGTQVLLKLPVLKKGRASR